MALSDNFHINQSMDEDGNEMYDCNSDSSHFKTGINGSHLITPFQCDLCIFCNLFKQDLRPVISDEENLVVIHRMNHDTIR